jgi:hypothetical protein
LVVSIRVPGKKQLLLQPRAVGQGVAARAGELRPAKPNPNATPAPTTSFEAAKKLRRVVESVAFPLAQTLRELFPSRDDPIATSQLAIGKGNTAYSPLDHIISGPFQL